MNGPNLRVVIAAATNARACEECGASVGEPCRVYCTGPTALADHTTLARTTQRPVPAN